MTQWNGDLWRKLNFLSLPLAIVAASVCVCARACVRACACTISGSLPSSKHQQHIIIQKHCTNPWASY